MLVIFLTQLRKKTWKNFVKIEIGIEGFLQVFQEPNTDNPRIDYPRSKLKRDPEGKNFEWFVANEKGSKQALLAVTESKGLPYIPCD